MARHWGARASLDSDAWVECGWVEGDAAIDANHVETHRDGLAGLRRQATATRVAQADRQAAGGAEAGGSQAVVFEAEGTQHLSILGGTGFADQGQLPRLGVVVALDWCALGDGHRQLVAGGEAGTEVDPGLAEGLAIAVAEAEAAR